MIENTTVQKNIIEKYPRDVTNDIEQNRVL